MEGKIKVVCVEAIEKLLERTEDALHDYIESYKEEFKKKDDKHAYLSLAYIYCLNDFAFNLHKLIKNNAFYARKDVD